MVGQQFLGDAFRAAALDCTDSYDEISSLKRVPGSLSEVVQLRQSSDHFGMNTPLLGLSLTDQSMLCYNLHAGHGQMLRVVGLALGTGWDVLPYGFLSIKPRNWVIWGGNG